MGASRFPEFTLLYRSLPVLALLKTHFKGTNLLAIGTYKRVAVGTKIAPTCILKIGMPELQ